MGSLFIFMCIILYIYIFGVYLYCWYITSCNISGWLIALYFHLYHVFKIRASVHQLSLIKSIGLQCHCSINHQLRFDYNNSLINHIRHESILALRALSLKYCHISRSELSVCWDETRVCLFVQSVFGEFFYFVFRQLWMNFALWW